MHHWDTHFFQWEHLTSPDGARSSRASAAFRFTSSTSVAFPCLRFPYHKHKLANLHIQASPRNADGFNPAKVSYHIYRIGYHFRREVVEEACEALGYVPYENTFITTADLQQKQHDSVIAQAFAKHGANFDRVKGNEETPDQVRAAIKELFPRIPQNDLEEVVTRAWEKKTGRVGSAINISLPRRVQLAVIARIRHAYTDYDRLLAAFRDWQWCRKMVEPYSLKKLIEWRGETDDDEALEEIFREIIVIEDDDDDPPFAGRGDDSSDGASDTSIEISHRPAAAEDLKAEEPYERDHKFFQRQMPDRVQAQRNDLAKQRIQYYRSQEDNARSYAQNYQQPTARPLQPVYIPSHGTAKPGSHTDVAMPLVPSQTLGACFNERP